MITVVALVVVVALLRLRLADVPLERDEGEYAYAGRLILQGIPPYQIAYNMKFPGTYYAYAAMLAVFGHTAWGIHVGLIVVNAATALVLFFLGRPLIGAAPAAIGAAAFSVLTLDRWIMGVFAHATHFVLLPALAGLLLLRRALASGRPLGFLLAGVLLGTALLMKQHAAMFIAMAICFEIWHEWRRPARSVAAMAVRNGLLVAGAAIPFALVCAVLAAQGVLGRFWFWTFRYAKEYVSTVSLAQGWSLFVDGWLTITQATLPIWLLAAAGLVLLWLVPWKVETRVFVTGFLVASFLSACPGLYFRSHYFIPLTAAAGLLVGVAAASIAELLARRMSVTAARATAAALVAAVIVLYGLAEPRYLFAMGPVELSRSVYGTSPFVPAVEVARYVRERTTPGDRIAVVGSEPEIYFYADRKSATGYIYTYPLMEPQPYARQMQHDMIREIEAARPAYLVYVVSHASWLRRSGSEMRIFEWIERYSRTCYDLAGVVDIAASGATTVRWDGDAAGYQPRSRDVVYTYRRKGAAPCAAG